MTSEVPAFTLPDFWGQTQRGGPGVNGVEVGFWVSGSGFGSLWGLLVLKAGKLRAGEN